MKLWKQTLVAGCTFALATLVAPVASADDTAAPASPSSVHDFTMADIDGKEVRLKNYEGKVALIVNVASKCGLTKQYEQLTALHKQYRDQGLVILGFPANDFLKQEPGSNEEIKLFCQETYDVEFDMFSKISVKGDEIHPLYKFLTEKETNEGFAGEINWNFEKFLMNDKGEIVARFAPKTKPDAPEVIAAIEKELAKAAEDKKDAA